MRASALVVTAVAVVSACAGRGAPSAVDPLTGPVFEQALRLVADSAGLPDLHVDPRALAAGAGFSLDALVELDDAVLAARERVAARAGYPRADAFLAHACFRPFKLLLIGADTLRAPPLPDDLRRQCESEPGAGGRYVMIQEAPRPVVGEGGWRVRAYIVGVGTFQVWDAYVGVEPSDGHATLIESWWT